FRAARRIYSIPQGGIERPKKPPQSFHAAGRPSAQQTCASTVRTRLHGMTTKAFPLGDQGDRVAVRRVDGTARCAHTLVTVTFRSLLVPASNMLCDSRVAASTGNPPYSIWPYSVV